MKQVLLSAVAATMLVTSPIVAKETAAKDATVQEVNRIAIKNAKEDARSHQVKLVQEAIDSLKLAQAAVVALEHNDPKSAKDHIEKALGKLEVILASKNAPKMLPIDHIIRVQEFVGTPKDVEAIIKHTQELLDKGRVQEARALLVPLVSEIAVTTVNLPLATYPDALKLAASYMHDKKYDKAKEVLYIALSTFVNETHILPIPLLESVDLITAASKIAKENKQLALTYLDAADTALDLAEKLGYVSRSETTYKALHEQIEAVRKEIKGKNRAEKLFEKLIDSIKEFKSKIVSPEKK